MEYAILIVVGLVIVSYIFLRLDKQREKKQALRFEEYEKAKLSDEAVTKAQAEFEKRLEENAALPDGVGWQKAFIYWHLMRKWFGSLVAVNRYNEKMSEKIKSDWLEYMYLLEHGETLIFLSAEAKEEERRDAHVKEAVEAKSKKELIENAFAAAIGKEAIEQLERARNGRHNEFDRSGKKPMAPIGYHYFPTSI